MKCYGVWLYHELLDIIKFSCKQKAMISTPNHGAFSVNIGSERLSIFKESPRCVRCGINGIIWALESHTDEPPHLNLYGLWHHFNGWKKFNRDGLVLMTKDHVIPKSKGGDDSLYNLQTMCQVCNSKKSNRMVEISPSKRRRLRKHRHNSISK